jgi:hypothetical protein
MTKNLLIIGYCHLADGFLYASQWLKNYNIFFFPYLNYILDKVENTEEIFHKYLTEHKINICLWWNNSITYASFQKMYLPQLQHIYFNWDPFLFSHESYHSPIWKERLINKEEIFSKMNMIFTCFEKEVLYFSEKHVPITYNPPGFEPSVSYYLKDPSYECDISIICTNMYDYLEEFPDQSTNVPRYQIVNLLYENRDKFKFHIYGPEKFREKYPDCYQRFITYDECYKVFSNSKINLSIHPLVKELHVSPSSQEYFSERVPQILGCQGLLMTNSDYTHVLSKDDYVFIHEETNILNEIESILQQQDKYDQVRLNGHRKAMNHMQWKHWGEKIEEYLDKNNEAS